MPNDPTPLDIAKFKLDAFKVAIEMRIALMKAHADYNYRMMEVAELRAKVETDRLKLRILADAFQDYRIARRSGMQRVRAFAQKLDRHETALHRINYLALGELNTPFHVNLGWRGFWYLTSQCPVATAIALGKIKCIATDRKGKNFYKPSDPDKRIPDAPSSIRNALLLMDWSRKLSAVPRLGSPPLSRFADLLDILGKGGAGLVKEGKKELNAANKDLKRVREASWKNLVLSKETPKD